MGVEDYGTTLRPHQRRLTVQTAQSILMSIGCQEDPAYLPLLPSSKELPFFYEDENSVIEFLVYAETADSISKISVRFAVCQKESTVIIFLSLIKLLIEESQFLIYEEYSKVTYMAIDFPIFKEAVETQYINQRKSWRRLFGSKEVKTPVRLVYSHFQEYLRPSVS